MDPKIADHPLQAGDTVILVTGDDFSAPKRLVVTNVTPQYIRVLENNVPEEYRRDGLGRAFNNPNYRGPSTPYLALPPEIAGLERFWTSAEFFFRDGKKGDPTPADMAERSPEFLNETLHGFLESAVSEIISRNGQRPISGASIAVIQGHLHNLMERINVGRPSIIPPIKATAIAPDDRMVSVIYSYE